MDERVGSEFKKKCKQPERRGREGGKMKRGREKKVNTNEVSGKKRKGKE